MPAYAKFFVHDGGFRGDVMVGAHAGWSKLGSVAFTQLRPAGGVQAVREQGGVPLNEILVTKLTDSASPFLGMACATGHHIQSSKNAIVVKLDFTRANGRGGEIAELSITLHGVVMERDNTAPRSGAGNAPAERFRLRYRKMTYSNMPPSSPDVSQIVRQSLLMKAQPGQHNSGAIVVGMGDGSVKFVASSIG